MLNFNRFDVISGKYIEEIIGQSRIGYSLSNTIDFYDMVELSKSGNHPGSIISFYDYDSRKIYEPFQKETNVIYGIPVYLKNYFWILKGDYNEGKVTLFRYIPDEIPEMIIQLNIADLDTYNLKIIGEDVHIISQDDDITCYYPESFRFSKDPNESLIVISNKEVYLSAWIEEGWDNENNCASGEYKYYEKVIVRDFNGTILSEELGSLVQRLDGTWWIS